MKVRSDIHRKSDTFLPLMRLRHLIMALTTVALAIALPLLVVYKQVCLTSTSLRYNALCDSVLVLNREISKLKLISEHLSSVDRIENLGRNMLGLDYPTSDQIVIVRQKPGAQPIADRGPDFFAVLWRSLFRDKKS